MTEEIENKQALDIHGKPVNRIAVVALILIATFGGMLMQTSLGTALPTLMTDFNIDLSTAQQANTWFLLANGIMIPVSAYLATKFPTRWLYIIAYAVMLAGLFTAFSAPTSNWWIFIIGRILQAIAVGISMPLMQVVMVNMFSPKQMGAVMGLMGLVIGLSPAIGPTYAGWILDKTHVILGVTLSSSWRTIFLLPLIVVGICWILMIFFMRDIVPNKEIKLDFLSLVSSLIGFGAFLWGFTNVATDGWGKFDTVILPIVLGLIIIIFFVWRQFKLEQPFLDVKVFMNKQFALTTLIMSLAMMAMMGIEMMLPLYMQNVHGLSPLNSGLTLLPGALMMGLVSPLAGAAYDKVGARRLGIIGFAILTLGTVPFLFLTSSTPDHFITVVYGLRMFGIAMVFMPLTASAMNALPREESAHGTAANNTARQIASAIVVALLASVTQNIINNSQPSSEFIKSNPIEGLSKMVNAMLDGYHASFAIGLAVAIIGFILSFFLRKGKKIEEGVK
ncbi:MAG: multidrug efflux MFS transporter [Streptococcaceae bacterium]|nr:multidrug efflux MFS transporter [Streptococcaceae bacterium]MCL2681119.1 multidrug efflux MFS transporter [Streptococcaceae bacterium]MCL2858158.1 multidrug efflux MFS transporter [Streptococcaceae bacterium]